MKQRLRSPDGTNKDIDHGPGPVGKTRNAGNIGAAVIGQMISTPALKGLFKEDHRKGETNPNARLTRAQVDAIRTRYAQKQAGDGVRAIARDYGVDHTTISRIIHGKGWA